VNQYQIADAGQRRAFSAFDFLSTAGM